MPWDHQCSSLYTSGPLLFQSLLSETISAPVSILRDHECSSFYILHHQWNNLSFLGPSVLQSLYPRTINVPIYYSLNHQRSSLPHPGTINVLYTPDPPVFQPLYSRIINSPVYMLQDNHYSSLPHLGGPSVLQSLYLGTIIVPVVYSPNHQCSILSHSETVSSPVSIPQDHQCSSLSATPWTTRVPVYDTLSSSLPHH